MPDSFTFVCPFCNQKLDCDSTLENQCVVCPSCNNEIVPARNKFERKIRVAKTPQPEVRPAGETGTMTPSPQSTGQVVINNYVNNASPEGHCFGTSNFPKQRIVYILFGVFLGGWGVHNFYAGYTKEASIRIY